MVADPKRERMGVEEYLRLDSTSDVRYEYADGYAYAMSGGSYEHMRIAANVFNFLDEQFGEQDPCQAYTSDMRVQVAVSLYLYPDVTVSCDVADRRGRNNMVRSPHLVVEVLSSSTESYDRGRKFQYYRDCPSVQEYVLIDSLRQKVEVFLRQGPGEQWSYRNYGPGQEVDLESLDIRLPVDAIYKRAQVPVEEDL